MNEKYYRPISLDFWQGRIDDEEDYDAFRWHQIIQPIDLRSIKSDIKEGFGILGFCCDKGVAQNKGRKGTSKAPNSIRKEMANLPCTFPMTTNIYDCGNIVSSNGNLEEVQEALSEAVYLLLKNGLFPLILGGGHEIALGIIWELNDFLMKMKKANWEFLIWMLILTCVHMQMGQVQAPCLPKLPIGAFIKIRHFITW